MENQQEALIKVIPVEQPVLPRSWRGWGWKKATTIEDALNFLNSNGGYDKPVRQARIGAFWDNTHPEFYIFFQYSGSKNPGDAWGWNLATNADDVTAFLNGEGIYRHPVKEAQVAAYRKGKHDEFHVFYKRFKSRRRGYSEWGWKLATDPMDAVRFLNGDGGYLHPVTTARLALVNRGNYDAFYIFYQKGAQGVSVPNWYWKLATTPDDAHHFANGIEGYRRPVRGFEMTALDKHAYNRFYVFANQGTRLWIQQPLEDERFVQGEAITLQALYTCERVVDGSRLHWSSDKDGELGTGPVVVVHDLSIGTHQITVRGCRTHSTIRVRIFTDQAELFMAPPSKAELERADTDAPFHLSWN